MKTIMLIALLIAAFISGCSTKSKFDASGSFEAVKTIISSNADGTIKRFDVEEGENLKAGQVIGYVDTLELHLRKEQLKAQIRSTLSQVPNIPDQLAPLYVLLETAEREQRRVDTLAKGNAVTQKQLDDANSNVSEIEKKIQAQKSSLEMTTDYLQKQAASLNTEVEEVDQEIKNCVIVNPVSGTVLTKFAEQYEVATIGKPLYEIADLTSIVLRAYITGDQLDRVKLNQTVSVYVDNGPKNYREYPGTIEWISAEAEFTPKNILTRSERSNLVYAIKVRVKNDGFIKLGMYGEVRL